MIKSKNIEYIIIFLFLYSIFLKFGGGIFHIIPGILSLGISFALSLLLFNIKSMKYYNQNILYLIGIFILVVFFGLLSTNAPIYGQQKLIYLIIQIIFYIPITPILIKHSKVFLIFSTFFLILFITSMILEFGNIKTIINSIDENFRLGEEEENSFHPIGISRYLGFCLIPIIFNLSTKTKSLNLVFSLVLIVISSAFLFFSASRGPILALLIILVLRFFVTKTKIKAPTIFFIFTIVLISNLSLQPLENKNLESLYEKRFSELDDSGRLEFLIYPVLSHIAEKPILGHGTGNFAFYYAGQDIRVYPHNILIEILYENGIIGFIIIILIFGNGIKKFRFTNSNESSLFFYLFIYSLINSQFSGDISSNVLIFFFLNCFLYINKLESLQIFQKKKLL